MSRINLRSVALGGLALTSLIYASASSALFVSGLFPRHRAETAWFIAAILALITLGLRAREHRGSGGLHDVNASGHIDGVVLLCFVGAAIVLYFPTLNAGLFSDDFVLLSRARAGAFRVGDEFFRPFPFLIWQLTSRLGRYEPYVLHVLSTSLHAVNGWLIYVIAREVGVTRRWSLVAGGLFVTSPSSVEPVVWLSGLFDIMMTTGTLMFIVGSLKGHTALACVALVIALLSKESGVAASAMSLFATAACGRRLRIPIAGVAITVVYIGVRVLLLPPPPAYYVVPSRYVLKELVSRAFGTIELPWTAAEIGDYRLLSLFPWMTLVGIVAMAIVVGCSKERLRVAAVMLVCVIVSVLPVYSYFFVSPDLEGSRYIYLATAAASVMLAAVAAEASARRIIDIAASASVLAAVACGSVGVRMHQRPWIAAAVTRDAVLAAAKARFGVENCASISVRDLPDSINGAYVFRNGFADALTMSEIESPPIRQRDSACTYDWNGREFVRVQSLRSSDRS